LSQIKNDHSGLSIEPIPAYKGERLYRQYQQTEIKAGDPWAASVLRDYDTVSNSQGSFWRCLLFEREIGCAMLSTKQGRWQVRLNCQPGQWGKKTAIGLVNMLIGKQDEKIKGIAVYLGSSAHHQAVEPLFNDLGFRSKVQWRMLMFKEIKHRSE
jgi:hypothetical protein